MLVERTFIRNALFWDKVNVIDDDNSCWCWRGAVNDKGYGFIDVTIDRKQKRFYAHRVSWEWENDCDIPEGMIVRHTCDNPPCVRPSHLVIGTHQQNTNDKMERGRYVSGVAEISPQDAYDIRVKKHGGITTDVLCQQYGLSQQHINSICRGVYWPQAGGPFTSRFELNNELICAVLVDLETMSRPQCAEKHGISLGSVANISSGKRIPEVPLFFYNY